MKKILLFFLFMINLCWAIGAKYLIITHDNFYDAILPLAQWKHKKGVPTKVVKLSDIGAGPSDIAIIKNYIVNAYNTWSPRPEYVLLVGDVTKINSQNGNQYDDYYGNMDSHHRMEIAVGRFPCATASQCSLLVIKTLGYERTPYILDPNWFMKGSGIIDEDYNYYPPINSDTVYWNDFYFVKSLWQDAGYIQIDSFSRVLGNNGTQVENAINNGRAYLLYRGQSVYNWGSPFTINISNLNNNLKLPIIVSATCQTVATSSSSCQGDKFMNAGTVQNPAGAVGFLGTSVVASGTGLGRCRGIVAQGFYRALFKENIRTLGEAAKWGKFLLDSIKPTSLPAYDSIIRYREWNLLGDPELNCWTQTPSPITVVHDTIIVNGPQNYLVTVTKNGSPLRNALVCVMMDTTVYQYGLTNSSGQISFNINVPIGTMSVTVTARNCIPYEKDVIVQPGGLEHDVSVYSIIEPIGIIASGITVYPRVKLINYGSHTDTFAVTFKIGSVYSQTLSQVILAAGDTVTKQFPGWFSVLGNYSIKAWTSLASDQWRGNDTAFGSINVVLPHDVGVIAILTPKDTIVQGISIAPKAVIKNFGANSETFSVTFKIGSGYSQTLSSVTLGVNVTDTLEFPNWFSAAGTYSTQCYTQLGNDNNRSNDTLNSYVFVGSEMLVEGFNNETFPPPSWSSIIISGSYNWQRVTSGTNPTCIPYEGTGMAFYNSYSAQAGSKARLITSPIELGIIPTVVQLKFWMYHDNGYQNYRDSIIVEFSSDGINFNRVQGFGRYSPTNAWIEHSIIVGPDTGTIYIGFLAQSQYGNNMYIDYIRVLPPPPSDVGVYSIQSPLDRLQIGVPQNVTATLKNYGGSQATFLSRAEIIDSTLGTTVFLKDSIITLSINETQVITFGQFTPSANKIYQVIVNTNLANDVNRTNDTMRGRAKTTPGSNPDSVGYFYESTHNSIYGDTVTYNWIDGSAKFELTGWSPSADDGNIKVGLPFAFPYYGQILCSLYVNTNGFLQFPTTFTSQYVANQPLPYASINNFIGALWDDLDLRNIYTPRGKVYQYNDPNNQFVVFQWDTVPLYNQTSQRNTFQIILFKDGRIKYQYKRVSTNAQTSSTVGIQGGNGSNNYFLQYIYNGSPSSHIPTTGTAILFNHIKDVGPVSIEAPINAVDSGAEVIPVAVIRNYGPNPANITVKFEINDGYSDTQTVTIQGRSNQIVSFAPWTARYFGTYTTKCSTLYTDDHNSLNNKITNTIRVRFHDVGVLEITSPRDSVASATLPIIAKIKNFYIRTASCSTKFTIRNQNDSIIFEQKRYVANLLPESIQVVNFGNYHLSPGQYYTKVWTILATDDNVFNDTLSDSVKVLLAIPVLNQPANLSVLYSATPFFDWSDVDGASEYQIQIDNDNNFLSPEIDTIISASQLQIQPPGFSDDTFFWRVRAGLPYSFWSETRQFIINTTSQQPGWTQKEPIEISVLNAIKDGGALIGVGNELYAFVGSKTNKFKKYTINSKSGWTTIESLPFGPKYPRTTPLTTNKKFVGKGAALCYDGVNTIYATRGNGTREFWSFNLTTRTWTLEESIPVPKGLKYGTALAFNDGKVYLLAGGQKKTDVNNFYVYDTATKHWSISVPLPLGSYNKVWKDGSCLTVCNGIIYALKGGDKNNLFYAFNGSAWSVKETMPMIDTVFGRAKTKVLVKAGGCMASDGNVIYAIKGGGTDCFWRYAPNSGIWQRLEPIPVGDKKYAPKTGAAMAYASGRIWLLVGNKRPDFWCYTIGVDRIKQVTASTISSITTNKIINALRFNFDVTPNPFNKLTTIRYTVPVASKVTIKLYNSSGRLIKTLVDNYQSAGSYSLQLDNLNNGIYFVKYQDINNCKDLKLIKL